MQLVKKGFDEVSGLVWLHADRVLMPAAVVVALLVATGLGATLTQP